MNNMDNLNNEILDEFEEDELQTIQVVTEDDEIIDCIVIDAVKLDDIEYLLVVPQEDIESDTDKADAFILKTIEEKENEIIYSPIEDDKEYEKVIALLQKSSDDYTLEF